MKSRTSFFNLTVLRKNITRFAPAWVLYGLFLLMFMIILSDWDSGVWYADTMVVTISPMAALSFGYALLCSQLLFGDLYSSRMCNALHAMPLRREGWFITNLVSGLLFSLVPNAVVALLSLLLVGGLWEIPLLWLAAVTLQYLFFFGTAVLASHCVGNRFAMALVYIIINGFSLISYWLVNSLFEPTLYGIIIREELFYICSPVVKMFGGFEYITIDFDVARGMYGESLAGAWQFADGWGYLAICAVLGIGCMALGLVSYRRRNLECAGDFVSVKWLGPVFLILYTLCGGACCHGFFGLFMGANSDLFLLLGFVIGFFTGMMLLERTVRVFRKKNLLAFGAFLAAFTLCFLAVKVDIFGFIRWVPEAGEVKSVSISTGGGYYYGNTVLWEEADEIQDMLTIHQHGVDNRDEGKNGEPDVLLNLTYTMKNGAVREREYYIDHDTDAGRLLRGYMSQPQMVLGDIYTGRDSDWTVTSVMFPDPDTLITDDADIQSLLDAIIADCEAGNMGQDWNYREEADLTFWMGLEAYGDDDLHYYRDVLASSDCENVMAWMEEHGIDPEKWN